MIEKSQIELDPFADFAQSHYLFKITIIHTKSN